MGRLIEWLSERTAESKGGATISNFALLGALIFFFIYVYIYFKKK
jgi:hypothetical protein